MKILLVQPPKPEKAVGGDDFSIFEPLALEYLAAGIAGNHDVRILDMRLDPDLDSLLHKYQPDAVGITSYTVHVNTVKRLSSKSDLNTDIFTIVGGHHATVMPEDFYTPYIDVIIVGEGVFLLRKIISRLEKKMAIPGFRKLFPGKTEPSYYATEIKISIWTLFHSPGGILLADYRKLYSCQWMKPLASIRTSKGCLFKCNFCALWKLTGGRYLTRKPEYIVEELGTIEEKCVFFADDESLLDTKRMRALADLIRRTGIRKRYFLYGRSDTIAKHPKLIEQWKKIGLERVFVGLEFIGDADLKWIRKDQPPKTTGGQ